MTDDLEARCREALLDLPTGNGLLVSVDDAAAACARASEAAAAQTAVNIGIAVGPDVVAEALEKHPPMVTWKRAALNAMRRTP